MIAGITWQDGNRQTLLFVTPDGDASLVALPGEDVEIWRRYRVPFFPAHGWRLIRDGRLIR